MSASPTPSRWSSVKTLFEQALQQPAGQRQAWVRASGVDAPIQAEVLSLLAHCSEDGAAPPDFMEQAAGLVTTDAEATAPPELGQRCGNWALLSLLGSGGMGNVYRARRADGAYDTEAAVKMLKRGMDSAQVLARFAHEQQALARLEHPHIARLYDAGLSAHGQPYFVMELVEGQPIDAACQGLPLEQRLDLFLQLAEAVSCAHRQLLVHRDLKPSNVLVNAQGQVKLLDFGIAKALDPQALPSDAELTQAGERPFTPLYASPEQVRGEAVSTATDLYSLGVLLYVMLTGVRPYGRSASSAREMAQCVLEETPTRPSALGPGQVPQADWLSQRRRLRGDLDKILLKALEKPLERRYRSVDALAADVRAYLGGYPVSARPASWAYVASQFVKRHRLPVALSVVLLLTLVAGLVTTRWQMQQAQTARAQAERRFTQVRQLARQLVFGYHDQIAALPGATQVREALLSDAVGYLDGLNQELGDDATLARELAESYSRIAALQGDAFSPSLERLALAEQNLDKALALLPRYLNAANTDLEALNTATEMWQGRALLHSRAGRLQDAVNALEQGRRLSIRALALAPDNTDALSQLATLKGRMALVLGSNSTHANLGRVEEAGVQWREAEALFERVARAEPDSAQRLNQWAWSIIGQTGWSVLVGDAPQALQKAQQLLALRERISEMEPNNANYQQQVSMARVAMASALGAQARYAEALQSLAQAEAGIQAQRRQDANNLALNRDLTIVQMMQARTQYQARPGPEARQALQAALQAMPDSPELANDFYKARWRAEALLWNARALSGNEPGNDAQAALRLAEQAQALMSRLPASPSNANLRWMQAQALGAQAQAQQQLGRVVAAKALAAQALALWRAQPTPAYFSTWVEHAERLAAGA